MIKVIQAIGCVVFSILMMGVPILTTCAFIYGWPGPITGLLVVIAVLQFIALLGITVGEVSKDNEF